MTVWHVQFFVRVQVVRRSNDGNDGIEMILAQPDDPLGGAHGGGCRHNPRVVHK